MSTNSTFLQPVQTDTASERRAQTSVPIVELLSDRWSPRAFDRDASITDHQLNAMLEAARWAPSAANIQPRRFIAALRGTREFDAIVGILADGNRIWAQHASALVAAIAIERNAEGAPNRWADYDLGASLAHLTVQAHALGLHVHQMGGLDAAVASERFDLPAHHTVVSVTAIGMIGSAFDLDEPLRSRELAERSRMPLAELLLSIP